VERDTAIKTLTETVKLLNRIASHRLIAQSTYPELQELAETAAAYPRQLVVIVGDVRTHWPDE
jgi:uncharacterized membrane protein YjjP (DUF1212 family)